MRQRDEDQKYSRRSTIGKVLSGIGLVGVTGTVTAQSSDSSNSNQPSAEDQPEEEAIKHHKQYKQEVRNSVSDVYQEKKESGVEVKPNDLVGGGGGSITIEEGGSHGTQSGNFQAEDTQRVDDILETDRAETKLSMSGVTNEVEVLARSFGGGDTSAWAETGMQYHAEDTGDIEVFAQGLYSGQVVAASTGTASLDYEMIFWDQTNDELVKKDIIWSLSSWLVGGGAKQDESFNKSMEVNVTAENYYTLTIRAMGTASAAGGDALADGWRNNLEDVISIPGYLQWTSMSYDWLG